MNLKNKFVLAPGSRKWHRSVGNDATNPAKTQCGLTIADATYHDSMKGFGVCVGPDQCIECTTGINPNAQKAGE